MVVVAIAAAAFVGGLLFVRPSEAQPKEHRPAPAAIGRYQAVPLAGGDFAVVDTATSQSWRYNVNRGDWSDLGTPLKQAK
jgi:hypothetical protein